MTLALSFQLILGRGLELRVEGMLLESFDFLSLNEQLIFLPVWFPVAGWWLSFPLSGWECSEDAS